MKHQILLNNLITNILKKSKRIAIAEAEELLKKVGLYGKRNNFPKKLSGGQQQRAAIARALAMKPEVLLFDEPTSALDPETIGEVLKVIEQLADEGMTMLVVTHELNFAKNISTRVMMMDDGLIVDDSETKLFFNSQDNIRKTSFLGTKH